MNIADQNTGSLLLTYRQATQKGINIVGSKAFNVALCSAEGFRVPDGLILSTQAFEAYLQGENSEELFLAIQRHFTDTPSVVVRSSALEEDTANASFAGQFLTLVCKNNPKAIRKACEACWDSYSSSHVSAYKESIKNSESPDNKGMGLLIQKMIMASTAGVCFTRDPIHNDSDHIVINGVHGLGEALVSGEVVADQYTYDINNKAVIDQTYGKQTHWRSPENPDQLLPLPGALCDKPVLSSTQLAELSQLAQNIYNLFGTHQDIEWVYEGENLHLLQARPITQTKKEPNYELWTRDNVADVIPDAVTPYTWDLVNEATNNGFIKMVQALGLSGLPSSLFKIFDGRVYFNQTAYQGVLTRNHGSVKLLSIALHYLRLLLSLKGDVSRFNKAFSSELGILAKNRGSSSIKELKRFLEKYMALHIKIAIMLELGFLVIRKIVKNNLPDNERDYTVNSIVSGLNEIESTESGEALWELSCLIKDNKILTEKILSTPEDSIPNLLLTWGEPISNAWQRFLDRFGHSSLREFEIYFPRWSEDQSFIVSTLKNYLRSNIAQDQNADKTKRAEERKVHERKLLKNISFIFYPILKFFIKHVQECSIWREAMKQNLVRIMATIRKQTLSHATSLEISPMENIFFLTLDEISQIEQYKTITHDLSEELTIRKQKWKGFGDQKPFKEIRVYPDGHLNKIPYVTKSGNHINGLALSSGKYTGKAKVILDMANMDSFDSGDILVARSTNPSWTPLFTLAGAILTDMGNYLSHGAIVAREMGIPAVGNLFDATSRIKDGQLVEVDGNSGTVILFE